jgi:hypothetical protein
VDEAKRVALETPQLVPDQQQKLVVGAIAVSNP